MRCTPARSTLCLAALCLATATALAFSTSAFAAAKKAKPAARKKAAPSSSDNKASGTAAPSAPDHVWEAPPRGEVTETPAPPPAAEANPAAETKPAAESALAAPAETKPAPEPAPPPTPPVETPVAPDTRESAAAPPEELPAFSSPIPLQHLGPSAYPGDKRGLYGGSLWLEPSFHGLQWPYMTRTGVGVSGLAWVDNGYQQITREGKDTPNTTRFLQQARAVLRATPTYASGRFFIQAQAEVVANGCQSTGTSKCDMEGTGTVDTDDLWVRMGHWNVWDLKVGRFEGWELYHTGMGLDMYTLERRGAQVEGTAGNTLDTPDFYGLDFLRYRPRGMGLGYVAGHAYFTSFLRLEVLGELGTDQATGAGHNIWGARPLLIFDLGWLKLKAGVEYEKTTSGTDFFVADPSQVPLSKTDYKYHQTRKGYGVAAQVIFEPWVEFGGNLAQGSQDQHNDTGGFVDTASFTKTSVGGFANFRVGRRSSFLEDVMVGGGAHWTTFYDQHRANGDSNPNYAAQLQIFGAVQYLLAKQLFIKLVVAYARADFQPTDSKNNPDTVFSNVMLSGRLRLMYVY